MTTTPALDFTHLARLTDDTGLFEHARHATVRREHGYCTDDVARGLLVTSREPDPSPEVLRLAECYLTFLAHAQDGTGAFRNRLGHDRRWSDEPGVGDWWGRAVWGLGTAAARSAAPWIRREALGMFMLGAMRRSPAVHAMSYAGLGAAEVLRADPGNTVASALLRDAATAVGVPAADPLWPWPRERLTYGNASLAEVVVAAGHLLRDDALLAGGLRMLRWLHGVQESGDRLSVVAATGWRRDGPRERFDQQPIEVAALADAAATAIAATGQRHWDLVVRQAAGWFLGDNDGGVVMWDPLTGGGFDGLTPDGPNLNQGAESTLALLSTMQIATGTTGPGPQV
ncbi:glycosyltransferase [Dactylosporangium sp. NPDC005555]|uniref:glycosyltransferase n=1 Tax=Dactylosporangium sp. NPDC005555 TaxID=3154889 RepID=UPI0033B4427D